MPYLLNNQRQFNSPKSLTVLQVPDEEWDRKHWCVTFSDALSKHDPVLETSRRPEKPISLASGTRKDDGKEVRLKPRLRHATSGQRPHSLADLKAYKDTKILVAKFLEHSSCSLPPEVQQVVNSIKFVIKSDERHMEEAIFSANVIDRVSGKWKCKSVF